MVVRSVLIMFLTRMGSLNALEQTRPSAFWRRCLGVALPSADSTGRIVALLDPDTVREVHQELYTRLKRNKALAPATHGLMALVLDGHESHATYRRCCSGCLQRRVKTKGGERFQYYHRNVTAMLLGQEFPLLLDAEPIKPGEDELAAAIRLLKRVLRQYPRAFDVVLGDALYADGQIFNLVVDHGKDALSVLKANNPDLLVDAVALTETMESQHLQRGKKQCEVWDLEGFTTWPQVQRSVRVVQSRETTKVRRQLNGQTEETVSKNLWVTTLSVHRAPTAAIVELGHARWNIENQGFNETVNRWFADHIYKHDGDAILHFWLLAMLAFNLFHAFFYRNLKPQLRQRVSYLHVARWMTSDVYTKLPGPAARSP